MTRRAILRASDADREQIAERLRQAAAEGRLFADELEDRLAAAFSAKTYGELDPLVADLPAPAPAPSIVPRPERLPARINRVAVAALALVAVMIIISTLGAVLGGGHDHGAGPAGFVWVVVWVAFGWRVLTRRRDRTR